MPKKLIALFLTCVALSTVCFAQKQSGQTIPPATLLLITKAEDERRWDDDLRNLFANSNSAIRKRAALAAGRIGNEDSIAALINLMQQDQDPGVRGMAAFAIGEVESDTGANALVAVLRDTN